MRYLTQTIPCLDNNNLVEFYVHDTEAKTVEKVICTKESALAIHQYFRDLNKEK